MVNKYQAKNVTIDERINCHKTSNNGTDMEAQNNEDTIYC